MNFIEFGSNNHRVFPVHADCEELIEHALRVRGYNRIRIAGLATTWFEGKSGIAVYQVSGDVCSSLIFTAHAEIVADLVIDALRILTPTASFRRETISRPE